MSQETVKFKDVPKGKRLQQFWDYYKTPLIIGVLVAIGVFSLIKTFFFPHVPQVEILAATSSVYLNEEQIALFEDSVTKSGFEDIYTEYVFYPFEENVADIQYLQAANAKLVALLTTPKQYLYLVDEEMFAHMDEQNILGTYEDLGETGRAEIVKIPLKSLSAFASADALPDSLYLCIRKKETAQLRENEKKILRYESQMNFLRNL